MPLLKIPWNDGTGGNIYVSSEGYSGNQTLTITSDANTTVVERVKGLTVTANDNGVTIIRRIYIMQDPLDLNDGNVEEPIVVDES